MPRHWLLKTEPGTYSWADLVVEGRTRWDGVRNHQAAGNLRAMTPGDLALIYHSGTERAAVGIARVVGPAYPDPADARFAAVDLEPDEPLANPVPLAIMKADPALTGMSLFRQSRLSVVDVDTAHWEHILTLSRTPQG